jgi:CubicO group peptidase (beta-lactamase class C family)
LIFLAASMTPSLANLLVLKAAREGVILTT